MLKILLVLFFIYGVSYSFVPYAIPTSYIVLLSIIVLIVKNKLSFYIPYKFVVGFSITLFSVSLASFAINAPSSDLYMVKVSLVYLLMLSIFPFYIRRYYRDNCIQLLRHIGIAGFINALFIISMLLFSQLQNAYLSLVSIDTFSLIGGADALDSLMRLRMIGITGFSAYSTGFVQVSCALCYLVYMNNVKARNIDYIMWGLILVSAMIAARSSIIGVIILLVYYIYASKLSVITKGFFVSMFVGTLVFIITYYLMPVDTKDFFIQWITEVFTSGTQTGSVQSNIKMYIYGIDDFSILGDSRWFGDNNDYYMNTDVGWYRVTFSIGIVGCILWALMLLLFPIEFFIRNKLHLFDELVIILFYVVYIFALMMKGAILFDSYQSLFFLIVFYVVFSAKRMSNEIKT